MSSDNDGLLSQEEIDMLLKQSGEASDSSAEEAAEVEIDTSLEEVERDALGEIGNISFGSASTALSTILSQRVEITTPQVDVISREQFVKEYSEEYVMIIVNFVEGLTGHNLMLLKVRDAQVIANIMMGGDGNVPEGESLSELHLSAVQEAMNQMMGSAATAMASIFNRVVNISPPIADIIDWSKESQLELVDEWAVRVAFRLRVGNLIDSHIMQLLPFPFAKDMVKLLMGETAPATPAPGSETAAEPVAEEAPAPAAAAAMPASASAEVAATATAEEAPAAPSAPQPAAPQVQVQRPEFTPLSADAPYSGQNRNLEMLLDIPMQVTVELGRTRRMIKDILDLTKGSIVELDKLAGEPVDIFVNQKLIARGEVVVIDENFGVRVTEIVNPRERIKTLQDL